MFKHLRSRITIEKVIEDLAEKRSKKIHKIFPWSIAGPYKEVIRMISEEDYQYIKLVKLELELFYNLSQLLVAIGLSSYHHQNHFHDSEIERIFTSMLSKDNISMGKWWEWMRMLFKGFSDNTELLFIPELHSKLIGKNKSLTKYYSKILEQIPNIRNIKDGHSPVTPTDIEAEETFEELLEIIIYTCIELEVLGDYAFLAIKKGGGEKFINKGFALTPDRTIETDELLIVDTSRLNLELFDKHVYLFRKDAYQDGEGIIISDQKQILDLHPFLIFERPEQSKRDVLLQFKDIKGKNITYGSFEDSYKFTSNKYFPDFDTIRDSILSRTPEKPASEVFVSEKTAKKTDVLNLKNLHLISSAKISEFLSEHKDFTLTKYVIRNIDQAISDFIFSSQKGMVITGQTGKGKTYTVANFVSVFQNNDKLILIPLSCVSMSKPSFEELMIFLFRTLFDDIDDYLSRTSFGDKLRFLKDINSYLIKSNKTVVIIFEELSDLNVESPQIFLTQINTKNELRQLQFCYKKV